MNDDIIQLYVSDDLVRVEVEAYCGEKTILTTHKSEMEEVRIGGTASNEVLITPCTVHSTFIDEDTHIVYAMVYLRDQLFKCLACGPLLQGQNAYIVETYDLDEKMRFVAIRDLPTHYRRHFINIDIRSNGCTIRRMRIDPFFGKGKVIPWQTHQDC